MRRVHPCRIMGAMSANPEAALPIRLTVDDSDSPADVVDALFLGRFATGEQPYSHSSSLDRVKSGATLLPPAAKVLRAARDDDRSATLAEGDGWTLLISRWNRGADVTVTATTPSWRSRSSTRRRTAPRTNRNRSPRT